MNLASLTQSVSHDLRHSIDRGRRRARSGLEEARSFAGSRTGVAIGATAVGVLVGLLLNPARKVAWQGHEALAGEWDSVLKQEHRMVEAAFEMVMVTDSSETARRAALFKKINWALLKHGTQEEVVIYPALRAVATEEEAARHLYEDHADIKTLLYRLATMPKDDAMWLAKMGELQALVLRHAREEEEEIFPRFKERLSPEMNRKLTLDVHREGVRLA